MHIPCASCIFSREGCRRCIRCLDSPAQSLKDATRQWTHTPFQPLHGSKLLLQKILAIIWNSHCQAFSEMSRLQVRIPKCFVCKAHHLFANALPIHRPYHLSKSRHARSQLGANVLRIFTLELQMDLQDILKLGIHVLS